MKIRDALQLVEEFVIFTDNNRKAFQYEKGDPVLDEIFNIIAYTYLSHTCLDIIFDQGHTSKVFHIEDRDGFSYVEELLVEDIIDAINRFKDILSCNELCMVLRSLRLDTLLRAINTNVNGKYQSVLSSNTRNILIKHILKMEDWASQTYENEKISFVLGIDLYSDEKSTTKISDLYNDAMLKVLSSGVNTILVCNRDGEVLKYEKLEDCGSIDNIPLVYSRIACWSKNRLAIGLSTVGEIFVFFDQTFLYLKRSSKWYPASSSPLLNKMDESLGYNREMRIALINTCYDISFRRCGACIGIVNEDCPLVYEIDKYRISATPRARFFRQILGNRKFQEIDREARVELAAIDGATVIDKEGNIIALGAILKINSSRMANRTTGGRSVAARQLAEYGIGIKISVDGSIEAWKQNRAGALEKFIEVL